MTARDAEPGHEGTPTPDLPGAAGAARLGALLAEHGLTFTAAESCTGGLVAAAVTAVPGSSAWFGTGFVTYANDAKCALLGVGLDVLERDGAVSEAVVRAMAGGARAAAGADVAVAISGVAGPGGGSEAKPVGTVWLAWAWPNGRVDAALHRFAGDRGEVRAAAVEEVLRATIEGLERLAPDPLER